jgi:hypothetical protein
MVIFCLKKNYEKYTRIERISLAVMNGIRIRWWPSTERKLRTVISQESNKAAVIKPFRWRIRKRQCDKTKWLQWLPSWNFGTFSGSQFKTITSWISIKKPLAKNFFVNFYAEKNFYENFGIKLKNWFHDIRHKHPPYPAGLELAC